MNEPIQYDRVIIGGEKYSPKQTASGLLSPYEFPELIGEILATCWPGRQYKYTEEYPEEDTIEVPTVTYHIYRRETGSPQKRQHKPTYMETVHSLPRDQQIYIQPWSVIYQFNLFANTNREANELCRDFEQFMFDITPILKDKGANEIIFLEQVEDRLARTRETFNVRSLRYMVTLQTQYIRDHSIIERINLCLRNELVSVSNELVTRAATGYTDQLAYDNVYTILSVVPTSGDSTIIYVEDIDFKLMLVEGVSYVYWNSDGMSPTRGDSYYVTYYYYKDVPPHIVDSST